MPLWPPDIWQGGGTLLHATGGLTGTVLGGLGPLLGPFQPAIARFGDSEQYNGCWQAPARVLGPKLRVPYHLTWGKLLPRHRVPLCRRTQDTEF